MLLTEKGMRELVKRKLKELRKAIDELQQNTTPHTPLPHPRSFKLFDGKEAEILWPAQPDGWYGLKIGIRFFKLGYNDSGYLAEEICKACKYQPTKILKVIRRLEAATEWCRKRTGGRKRAAEEILKQQRKAADALAALYTTNRPTNPAFSEELALRVVTSKLQELSEVVKSLLCVSIP